MDDGDELWIHDDLGPAGQDGVDVLEHVGIVEVLKLLGLLWPVDGASRVDLWHGRGAGAGLGTAKRDEHLCRLCSHAAVKRAQGRHDERRDELEVDRRRALVAALCVRAQDGRRVTEGEDVHVCAHGGRHPDGRQERERRPGRQSVLEERLERLARRVFVLCRVREHIHVRREALVHVDVDVGGGRAREPDPFDGRRGEPECAHGSDKELRLSLEQGLVGRDDLLDKLEAVLGDVERADEVRKDESAELGRRRLADIERLVAHKRDRLGAFAIVIGHLGNVGREHARERARLDRRSSRPKQLLKLSAREPRVALKDTRVDGVGPARSLAPRRVAEQMRPDDVPDERVARACAARTQLRDRAARLERETDARRRGRRSRRRSGRAGEETGPERLDELGRAVTSVVPEERQDDHLGLVGREQVVCPVVVVVVVVVGSTRLARRPSERMEDDVLLRLLLLLIVVGVGRECVAERLATSRGASRERIEREAACAASDGAGRASGESGQASDPSLALIKLLAVVVAAAAAAADELRRDAFQRAREDQGDLAQRPESHVLLFFLAAFIFERGGGVGRRDERKQELARDDGRIDSLRAVCGGGCGARQEGVVDERETVRGQGLLV